MSNYCGKCRKECGMYVSRAPDSYDTSEFWGARETTKTSGEVAAISTCHMAAVYTDEQCMEEFDPSTISPY